MFLPKCFAVIFCFQEQREVTDELKSERLKRCLIDLIHRDEKLKIYALPAKNKFILSRPGEFVQAIKTVGSNKPLDACVQDALDLLSVEQGETMILAVIDQDQHAYRIKKSMKLAEKRGVKLHLISEDVIAKVQELING